ncbi:hypothetical protein [Verrucomicrobium spinosum]|uniref:hypothetical protein n=1 Tax=Verrucomicrobium spinosum TaxID=2736 RepID=UPI0012E25EB8|nr:hypothetical protein [Verrucomicrobium spinosum]
MRAEALHHDPERLQAVGGQRGHVLKHRLRAAHHRGIAAVVQQADGHFVKARELPVRQTHGIEHQFGEGLTIHLHRHLEDHREGQFIRLRFLILILHKLQVQMTASGHFKGLPEFQEQITLGKLGKQAGVIQRMIHGNVGLVDAPRSPILGRGKFVAPTAARGMKTAIRA